MWVHDVGGIQPAAEAYLQDHGLASRSPECLEGQYCRRLEEGSVLPFRRNHNIASTVLEEAGAGGLSADPDALGELGQVRRGVEPRDLTAVPQDGIDKRGRGALPIRPPHVNELGCQVRVSERTEHRSRAIQPPADSMGGTPIQKTGKGRQGRVRDERSVSERATVLRSCDARAARPYHAFRPEARSDPPFRGRAGTPTAETHPADPGGWSP